MRITSERKEKIENRRKEIEKLEYKEWRVKLDGDRQKKWNITNLKRIIKERKQKKENRRKETEIRVETYNFRICRCDDSIGGKDEVQGEHGGTRQTKGEEAWPTLRHQCIDHLLQEPQQSILSSTQYRQKSPKKIQQVLPIGEHEGSVASPGPAPPAPDEGLGRSEWSCPLVELCRVAAPSWYTAVCRPWSCRDGRQEAVSGPVSGAEYTYYPGVEMVRS